LVAVYPRWMPRLDETIVQEVHEQSLQCTIALFLKCTWKTNHMIKNHIYNQQCKLPGFLTFSFNRLTYIVWLGRISISVAVKHNRCYSNLNKKDTIICNFVRCSITAYPSARMHRALLTKQNLSDTITVTVNDADMSSQWRSSPCSCCCDSEASVWLETRNDPHEDLPTHGSESVNQIWDDWISSLPMHGRRPPLQNTGVLL